MLGLDLFPGYDTFTASNIPVTGVLPILPGDYTANALFLGGGNTTTTAAMAGFAKENFDAKTAGIVSADNAGANGTEADLKKALDAAGITYVSIKGGDNETDAGFQGLMAQATADDPDVLFSLYADAGCIGTMRGRVSLGIETAGDHDRHLQQRRGHRRGRRRRRRLVLRRGRRPSGKAHRRRSTWTRSWSRTASRTPPSWGSAASAPRGCSHSPPSPTRWPRAATDVTGASIYETLGASDDLVNWPDGNPLACGSVASIPTICDFTFPIATYVSGKGVQTVPGYEAFDTTPFLP